MGNQGEGWEERRKRTKRRERREKRKRRGEAEDADIRKKGVPGALLDGNPQHMKRRRATLPHPLGCSTIAVQGLSFRVRNGTGRLTLAMVAANLFRPSPNPVRGDRTVTVREPDNGREKIVL